MKQWLLSCRIFTNNYPLLLDHILYPFVLYVVKLLYHMIFFSKI
ncbi:DUF2935 domain-containing protein [Clostridium estertheticum]|uniref:DUF2935 domain-containing protein n=1 Tax=Clostridium estertheticum TaxID=238834 RepID=A0A5N7INP7_9CLOT|nr:DUF2935 domain-containing protein [Clostridium estertheticum]MPQ62598.1 DUF2935 domain-containing protein [Clostridium estertheticum]